MASNDTIRLTVKQVRDATSRRIASNIVDMEAIEQRISPVCAPMLFRFVGGKFYALKKLKPFWEVPHDEYREPMVGGGSVFFAKPKVRFNWLNDIDTELMTTYSVITNPCKRRELLFRLHDEIATKERHREIREYEPESDIDVAFRYYYLNRTSFSGKMVAPVWGYREKRSVPPRRWRERIIPCGKKMEGVTITNGDFERVIRTPSEGRTLLFIDPPYFVKKNNSHYKHKFRYGDHLRLAELLKQTCHLFMLTYDDSAEIRQLYKWAHVYDLDFIYRVENSQDNSGRRRNGNEVVITNYVPDGFRRGVLE